MAWGVGSRCGTPLGAIQALGALLRQHPDPMPDPHQWRMLGLQDPWWPVVTPATLPLAPLPGGQHTWKQTTNKRKKQCNYCEHRCYQSCATCEILGLGHFAACGALAGRDCMKKSTSKVSSLSMATGPCLHQAEKPSLQLWQTKGPRVRTVCLMPTMPMTTPMTIPMMMLTTRLEAPQLVAQRASPRVQRQHVPRLRQRD